MVACQHDSQNLCGGLIDESRHFAVLGTTTETETIERAFDEIVEEDKRNKRAWKAHERFLRSDSQIDDVYGNLEPIVANTLFPNIPMLESTFCIYDEPTELQKMPTLRKPTRL